MTYEIIALQKNSKPISGETFGRLIAIAPVEKAEHSRVKWLCICDCGTEHIVTRSNLTSGSTKSCGCLNTESRIKHGMFGTPEHNTWMGLKDRCRNKNNHGYKYYGGRGISFCKEWEDFAVFFSDMGEKPSPDHSIDRIDNNGDYTPENCRWATLKEQARNKRTNRVLTHNGESVCVCSWADRLGINKHTLNTRLSRGWTIKRALTTPVR